MSEAIKFTTPTITAVYTHLEKPHAYNRNDAIQKKPKYKLTMRIPKNEEGEALRTEIENLWQEAQNLIKVEYNKSHGSPCPFYDGDSFQPDSEEPYPEFLHGHYMLHLYSDFQPAVLGPDGSEVDPSEAYDGMNCRVAFTFKTGVGQSGPYISRYVDAVKITNYLGQPINTNNIADRFE